MSDANGNPLVSLSEVSEWLEQKTGRAFPLSTIRQWTKRGVRGVHLPTHRVGGRLYTTLEAVQSFLRAIQQTPTSS